MTSQAHQHIPSNEPSVVVNISQTEVEPDVLQLPYPPELTLKRRFSETVNPRAHFWKRRKMSGPVHGKPVDCPCLPPPPYLDTTISGPWSTLDSAYSTLPTTPPYADTPAIEHPRKLSVAEFVEKLNSKLKRLFGSRRGSAEDEPPRPAPSEGRRSSVSNNISGHTEPSNFQPTFEELLWDGTINLPNVSEYFTTSGEAGPVSFYTTADWVTFQATLQAQSRSSTKARLNRETNYDGDTDLQMSDRTRKLSTRSSGRKRKDSHFSFSDLWSKSRRLSKADKGKGRIPTEHEAATTCQEQQLLSHHPEDTADSMVLPLTEIGVLPRASTDGASLLVHKGNLAVPEADFSSSKSSIQSRKLSAPTSPRSGRPPTTPPPTAQQADSRVMAPPPGLPEVHTASSKGSSPSSTSLSSVNLSDDSSSPVIRRVRRLAQNNSSTPEASPSTLDTRTPSLPIAVPSTAATTNHYILNSTGITITESSDPSTPSLSRHGDRPTDTAPPSPPLRPTFIPSPTQMQALSLGPPERPFPRSSASPSEQYVLSSSASSERLFHVSVEQLGPSTPVRSSNLARTTIADENRMDVEVGPSEGGSSVRRRTGTNLREAYVEHETDDTPTHSPRSRIPRKSVSQQCWWGEQGSPPPPPSLP